MTEDLTLGFDLRFEDLYRRDGLVRLDRCFVDVLKVRDADLHNRLMAARAAPDQIAGKAESDLIVELAPALEDFIAELFGIASEARVLEARHQALAPLYTVKRLFVQRRAAKKYGPEQAAAFDGQALRAELEPLIGGELTEMRFAERVDAWMKAEAENAAALELAARYAAWATHTPDGQRRHKGGILFKVPHKVDPHHLVPVETELVDGVTMLKLPKSHRRARDGFALTDPGTDLAGALDHANYCIWCHNQGKDSCSKGLKEKTGEYKKSAFGVVLAGCPLDEKISEMNLVAAGGHSVGALAVAIVDNPMCAATGHRICNDCMKACIYQKQEPVDIPQVETRVLKEVLALPWGFEIYGLLTRWNPLNLRRPLPRPASGCKVLVVGLGPAGFTLAHHLMNDGHAVVAVDGLKIEPLAADISGVDPRGARVPFRPIRDVAELREPLDARVMAGFGGVAEYGITVRWDKNFLKLIRLLLERRNTFAMFGGVRFGGTLTIDSAFALGFDHIALCAGAGRPTIVPMKNGLAAGVRQASDFLMALQLTGAAKTDSLANLQVRLPVVDHRRRADRDRHRDRGARLLSAAGGEVPRPLRDADRRARRGSGARRLDAARSGDCGRISGSRAKNPCRARGRGARGPHAAIRRAHPAMGRRHHRLPAAPDRCTELHAQSRRGGEGAGGGDRLCRAPHAGRGPARRLRLRAALRLSLQAVIHPGEPTATRSSCPRAPSWSRPAPSPTPCSAARRRNTSRSTASISRPSTRAATRSRRSASPSRRLPMC